MVLRIDVKNVGTGASGDKTYVSLKNLGDEKVFIKKGRQVLGPLKPGEVKTAVLSLELKKGFKPDSVPVRLQVMDEKIDEFVSERLELPVAPEAPVRPAQGAVRVTAAEAVLQAGDGAAAFPVALAQKGAVLPLVGRAGDFYKVEWQKGRHAFLAPPLVEALPNGRRERTVSAVGQREPPPNTTSAAISHSPLASSCRRTNMFPSSASTLNQRCVGANQRSTMARTARRRSPSQNAMGSYSPR